MSKHQPAAEGHAALSINWIRAEKYCALTGDPIHSVHERIRAGVWAAGKHYKRTGPRTLWINIRSTEQWIEQQPDAETAQFPRGRNQ